MKVKLLASAIAAIVLVLVVWGFVAGRKERATEAEREKPVAAASRVTQIDGLRAITLDAASQKRSALVVKPQASVAHRNELQAIGTVLSIQELGALRTGYVAAKAQADATAAVAQASAAEYHRLRVLHDEEQDVSTKGLQAGEASMRADQAAAQAAQAALTAAQQSSVQQWGRELTAAAASNSPLYMRLANQQDVLVQVVLPSDANLTEPPDQVRLQVRSGTFASARLISAAVRSDPRLQGASFLYVAPAAGLLPGTSLTVFLPVGSERQGALIPTSAIVWWQGQAWVYTQHGPDRFVRRELPVDQSTDGGWFVPSGFAGGEPIVVSGAQLLFSEELRSQGPAGETD